MSRLPSIACWTRITSSEHRRRDEARRWMLCARYSKTWVAWPSYNWTARGELHVLLQGNDRVRAFRNEQSCAAEHPQSRSHSFSPASEDEAQHSQLNLEQLARSATVLEVHVNLACALCGRSLACLTDEAFPQRGRVWTKQRSIRLSRVCLRWGWEQASISRTKAIRSSATRPFEAWVGEKLMLRKDA